MATRRNGTPAPGPERLISIGRAVKPHGLRGEARIHTTSEGVGPWEVAREAGLFLSLKDDPPDRLQPIQLESFRPHSGLILAKFSGIDDCDAVNQIRGAEVLIERERLPNLEADAFYHCDIDGLEVVDADSGELLGHVEAVKEGGGQDHLRVRRPDGGFFFAPFTRPFIVSVDLDARRVSARFPPGLMDLND